MMQKTILTILLVVFVGHFVAAGQNSVSVPQAPSRQAPIVGGGENEARLRQNAINNAERNRSLSREANHIYLENRRYIDDLYRKTKKKDLTLLTVNPSDSAKFSRFLKQKNMGLIKLLPNAECNKDLSVISASGKCLKYDFPGAGAAYSFRLADYRINRLSDLIFDGESFLSNGIWSQGILVAVGDIPLDTLTIKNPALKYLIEFQPSSDQAKAGEDQQRLINGVNNNGYTYAESLSAMENMTYAVRSIAYQGVFYREYKGIIYNELDFDKRKDIIVGFRVVRKESDGSVVILWKELNSKDSPRFLSKKVKKTLKN